MIYPHSFVRAFYAASRNPTYIKRTYVALSNKWRRSLVILWTVLHFSNAWNGKLRKTSAFIYSIFRLIKQLVFYLTSEWIYFFEIFMTWTQYYNKAFTHTSSVARVEWNSLHIFQTCPSPYRNTKRCFPTKCQKLKKYNEHVTGFDFLYRLNYVRHKICEKCGVCTYKKIKMGSVKASCIYYGILENISYLQVRRKFRNNAYWTKRNETWSISVNIHRYK